MTTMQIMLDGKAVTVEAELVVLTDSVSGRPLGESLAPILPDGDWIEVGCMADTVPRYVSGIQCL